MVSISMSADKVGILQKYHTSLRVVIIKLTIYTLVNAKRDSDPPPLETFFTWKKFSEKP